MARQGGTSSLLRHGSVYAAGDFSERLIGLVMLPVYAYNLSPAGFGVLALVQTLTGLGSSLLGFGIFATLIRYYYNPPEGYRGRDVVATAWPILIVLPLLVLVPLAVAGQALFASAFQSLPFGTVVLPALAITYLNIAAIEYCLAVTRTMQLSRAYVAVMLSRAVLTAGFSCVVLVALHAGPTGVVLGQLAASALTAAGCAVWLGRQVRPRLDTGLARELLRFGAPNVPQSTSLWALKLQDRILLDHLASTSAVGTYSMGSRLATPLQVLLDATLRVIQPTFSDASSGADGKARELREHVCQYVVWGLALTLGAAAVGPHLALLILPATYDDVADVVPLLLTSVYLMGLLRLASGAITFFEGKNRRPFLLTLAGVGLSIVGNLALIPRLGLVGCALASPLTLGVTAAAAWRISPLASILGRVRGFVLSYLAAGIAALAVVIGLQLAGHDVASVATGSLLAVGFLAVGARGLTASQEVPA